ncbi:hypothetical protein [Companilactobacillus furfuricola]|uniref:hypothetical protein n=1 Tax=Companilactobacillus furfuricola TaxID=1462575 RepID=UPI000F7A052D|nr:hypothetical protein [Companilactobacillus furfuricola]
MKKSIWAKIFLALILIFSLAGCSNIKQELGLEDKQQTKKDFKSGVPYAYKGYYGHGDKQNFLALELKQNKFLANGNKFHHIEYKQLDQNTYLIRGKNDRPRWHYFKMDFKIDGNSTKLGLYPNPSRKSEVNFDDTKNLRKENLTWYKSYELSDYNLMTGKTKAPVTKIVDLDSDYFIDKIFISDQHDSRFLSFLASPADSEDEHFLKLFKVTQAGQPKEISNMNEPKMAIDNSLLTITTDLPENDADNGFYKQGSPTLTFKILSKTKLKDQKTHETYTLFDGNFKDAIYTISDKFGYPTDYAENTENSVD